MKEWFHGSDRLIGVAISVGQCVSSEKCNALKFALRRRVGDADCYIYKLLLVPDDVKQIKDAAGVIDHVLTRDMPYVERILVTEELIAECKSRPAAMGLLD